MNDQQLDSIFGKLVKINQFMNQNLEQQARHLGYNTSEFLVILDVITYPGTDLNAMSDRLGLKKSTASKIVHKLVEEAVLIRKQADHDGRHIELTIGEPLHDVCQASVLQKAFSGYETSPCDLNAIETSLDNILDMLSGN